MTAEPVKFYDQADWEQFCAGLVRAEFNPVSGTERREWVGPTRASLRALTEATTMEIRFLDGWPVRSARVYVPGLVADHVMMDGQICLWADDDPAQWRAEDLQALWDRLDEWALAAAAGFSEGDRALDAWALFPGQALLTAELDLPALLGTGTDGFIKEVHATIHGTLLRVGTDPTDAPLHGVLYLRSHMDRCPRSLDEFQRVLRRRQREDLRRRLLSRADTAENIPSGGVDFAILVWPSYGQFDALVLTFSGSLPNVVATPNRTTPSDIPSRKKRAGPDALLLEGRKVLIAGAGAIGGYVATTLAASGVSEMRIHDQDTLHLVNLPRHVEDTFAVGAPKADAVASRIRGDSPWCDASAWPQLAHDPQSLEEVVAGLDLVVDCTGTYSVTTALAVACAKLGVPLITGALYHRGSLFRVRRQGSDDVPLLERHLLPDYVALPPDKSDPTERGFLELGCTAPVHNSPPVAVLRAATEVSVWSIDVLTRRLNLPDEEVIVLSPLQDAPFNLLGPVKKRDAA
jgi:molybdopterin/thiamine biosynthesis adenylyltransferase